MLLRLVASRQIRRALRARFFYVVSVPLLLGFIVYMLSYMPAANTSLVVKIDVGLAWCAHTL